MKNLIKRLTGLMLCVVLVMIAGSVPAAVFAADGKTQFSDWPNDWSTEALQAALDNGLMVGSNGKILPQDNLKRAEMAAIINRAFGAAEMAALEAFTDVPDTAWYRTDIAKAVKMGAFYGSGGGLMRPEHPITREEVFAVVSRAFELEPAGSAALDKFLDKDKVAEWAIPEAAAMAAAGYVNGDGVNLKPKDNITRAEFAQVMHNIVKTYIRQSATVSEIGKGNVLISAAGVILENIVIEGDLIIGEGAGNGTVTLDNVTVTGRIINRSGAKIVDKNDRTIEDDSTPLGEPANPGGVRGGGNNGGGGGSGGKVTVSFETNGGSTIPTVQVDRGSTFSNVPIPVKYDSAFAGWYSDSSLSMPFNAGTPILNNITLYAKYDKQNVDLKEYTDPDKYIEDCPLNYAVSIVSPIALSEANIRDHVILSSKMADELPGLSVTGNGTSLLSPKTPYEEGKAYTLSLLDERLTFSGEEAGVRNLTFRIHKDEVANMKYMDGIIDILWSDAKILDEDEEENYIFEIPAALYYVEAGEIIRIWDGEVNEFTIWRKVIASTLSDRGANGIFYLLHTEDCQFGEVYSELDLYFEELAPLLCMMQDLDEDEIAQATLNSQGTAQLAAMLEEAISQSPTVLALLAEDTETVMQPLAVASALANVPDVYFPAPPHEGKTRIDDLPIFNLLNFDSITADCAFGTTDNANFPVNTDAILRTKEEYAADCWKYMGGKYSDDIVQQTIDDWPYIWPYIELHVKFAKTFKDKIRVEAEVTIKTYLSVTVQGGSTYNGKWYDPASWDTFEFDIAHNIYARTDVDLDIIVKTKDGSGDFKIDININDEITKIMNGGQDSDPGTIMQQVLAGKGEYIDIVNVKILEGSIAIIPECPVGQCNLDLSFVIRLNAAAGISAHMSFLTAQQIGLCGNLHTNYLEVYRHNLPQNGSYNIDIDAAGYIGVKAGLKGSISVSLYQLPKLGKAGISLEVGAYGDLYGFVRAHIDKYREGAPVHTSVIGGLYFEAGIYGEIQLFGESEWFRARAAYTVAEIKIPLFTIGQRYVLLDFPEAAPRVLMRSDRMPLNTSSLYTANYLDIKTGDVITGDLGYRNRFSVGSSSRYFDVQGGDIVVRRDLFGTTSVYFPYLPPNTARVDGELQIYYNGTTLCAKEPSWLLEDGRWGLEWQVGSVWYARDTLAKTIQLTWLDPSVNALEIADIGNTVTAAYILDIDGTETVLEVKDVLPGQLPGAPTVTEQGFPADTFPGAEWILYRPVPGAPNLFYYAFNDVIMYLYNAFVTAYDDFYQPITANTVYRIHATEKAQGLAAFISYYGGLWNLDIYAVNCGDAPTPPPGYDSNAYKTFTYWAGERMGGEHNATDYGNIPENALEPAPFDAGWFVSFAKNNRQYMYFGEDTAAPLYHYASPNIDDCRTKKSDKSHSYGSIGKTYEAKYLYDYCNVTWILPQVPASAPEWAYTAPCAKGESISQTVRFGLETNTYKVLGFDTAGDGLINFTPNDFPVTADDMTVRCIYEIKKYNVRVLNGAGGEIYNNMLEYGTDLNGILENITLTPPSGQAFAYWEISRNSRAYEKYYPLSAPAPGSAVIRPVFSADTFYNVTFKYLDEAGKDAMFTVALPPGAYMINGYVPYTKPDDGINSYAFTGWYIGSTLFSTAYPVPFTVTDSNIEFQASYDTKTSALVYTVLFETAYGMLSTGGKVYRFSSTYPEHFATAAEFLAENSALADFYDNTELLIYKFAGWDGPALSAANRTITYTARWEPETMFCTFTYDAGDGVFDAAIIGGGGQTLTRQMMYGTGNLLPASSVVPPSDVNNAYTLTGWKDTKGDIYAPGDEYAVLSDMTFTAVYYGTPQVYTITVYPVPGGQFDDNSTSKAFSGAYGAATGIDIDFNMYDSYSVDIGAGQRHVFDGWYWYQGNQAGTKLNAWPAAFGALDAALSVTIEARTKIAAQEYTITFSANGGTFPGGDTTYKQDFLYNQTITGIPAPTRADDTYFTYSFAGWDRPLLPVTRNDTYLAQWTKTLKAGAPPLPTGIYISDSKTTEDINCVNSGGGVLGYTYAVEERYYYDTGSKQLETCFVPTLTIKGNGLTIGGSIDGVVTGIEDTIRIVIGTGVSSVTFENLSLTAKYLDDIINAGSNVPLTIKIKGECAFEKLMPETSGWSRSAVSSTTDTLFLGADESASVTISAKSAHGFSFNGDLTFQNLDLAMDVSGIILEEDFGNGPEYLMALAFNSDSKRILSFIDANVSISSPGGRFGGSVKIAGDTKFAYVSTDVDKPVIVIMGDLVFDNFTGTFNLSYKNPDAKGPAAVVYGEIKFIVNGSAVDPKDYGSLYDLGGLQVVTIHEDDGQDGYDWRTFGNPNPAVLIVIKKL